MKIKIGTKFTLKNAGYGQTIMTVSAITNDDVRAESNMGVQFITIDQLAYYNDLGLLKIVSQPAEPINEKLENARRALASAHVEKVEVGYEYAADGTRYYSAITTDAGIPHRYSVKVWEDADGATMARCNCAAKAECRHIAKVAKLDAQKCGRNVYYGSFTNYRAHEQRRAA